MEPSDPSAFTGFASRLAVMVRMTNSATYSILNVDGS